MLVLPIHFPFPARIETRFVFVQDELDSTTGLRVRQSRSTFIPLHGKRLMRSTDLSFRTNRGLGRSALPECRRNGASRRTVQLPQGVLKAWYLPCPLLQVLPRETTDNAKVQSMRSVTSSSALLFTGPLIWVAIRVASYPTGVKTAILLALAVMLESHQTLC